MILPISQFPLPCFHFHCHAEPYVRPLPRNPTCIEIPGISQGTAGRGSSLFHQPLKHSAPPESPSTQLSASSMPDEKEKPWQAKFPQAHGRRPQCDCSSAVGSVHAGCLAPSGWQVPPLPSSPHTSLPSALSVAQFPPSQRKVGQTEGSRLPRHHQHLRPPASAFGSNSLPPYGSNLARNSLAVSYSPPWLTHCSRVSLHFPLVICAPLCSFWIILPPGCKPAPISPII